MFPILFDSRWIGLDGALHFTLSGYVLGIVLGFALAAWLGRREMQLWGMSARVYTDFLIWMAIFGIVGSRVMHVLADGFFVDYVNLCVDPMALKGRALASLQACTANLECLAEQQRGQDIGAICSPTDGLCYPEQDCLRWAKFWAGGLTVYGSAIACTAAAWIYARRHNVSPVKLMDMGGYGLFLGIALGRLGCLAAGCCYGDICDSALGIVFPPGSSAYGHHLEAHTASLAAQQQQGVVGSLPVYPTQLISSAYNLAIFAVAYFVVRPRKRFHGQVMLTSVILYGLCRFAVEFIRDDFRGEILGLSTSQAVSVPLIAMAVGLLLYMLRRARRRQPVD